jgi:hypothetical protein
MRIETGEGVTVSGNGHRREFRLEVEDDPVLTRGSHQSARKGGRQGTGSGEGKRAVGWFSCLGRFGSPGSISYFYFLLSFSFSAFLILS